jgi:hypothetical protein
MRNISIIKRIFSPPKVGIAISIIVMFAMMFNVRAVAATRADLPDKVEKAVCVSPGCQVAVFDIVNIKAKATEARSTFDGQQLMVKSAAANQNPINSQDLYLAAKNEESIYLQAIVPPLISAQVVENNRSIDIGHAAKKTSMRNTITKPSATLEVDRYDIAINQNATANNDAYKGVTNVSAASAKTYNLGSMVVRA